MSKFLNLLLCSILCSLLPIYSDAEFKCHKWDEETDNIPTHNETCNEGIEMCYWFSQRLEDMGGKRLEYYYRLWRGGCGLSGSQKKVHSDSPFYNELSVSDGGCSAWDEFETPKCVNATLNLTKWHLSTSIDNRTEANIIHRFQKQVLLCCCKESLCNSFPQHPTALLHGAKYSPHPMKNILELMPQCGKTSCGYFGQPGVCVMKDPSEDTFQNVTCVLPNQEHECNKITKNTTDWFHPRPDSNTICKIGSQSISQVCCCRDPKCDPSEIGVPKIPTCHRTTETPSTSSTTPGTTNNPKTPKKSTTKTKKKPVSPGSGVDCRDHPCTQYVQTAAPKWNIGMLCAIQVVVICVVFLLGACAVTYYLSEVEPKRNRD